MWSRLLRCVTLRYQGISLWDGRDEVERALGPFDDEVTRSFYQDIPDLRAMFPAVYFDGSAAAKAAEKQSEEAAAAVAAAAAEHRSTQASGSNPGSLDDALSQLSDIMGGSSSSSGGAGGATRATSRGAGGALATVNESGSGAGAGAGAGAGTNAQEQEEEDAAAQNVIGDLAVDGSDEPLSANAHLTVLLESLPMCFNRDLVDKVCAAVVGWLAGCWWWWWLVVAVMVVVVCVCMCTAANIPAPALARAHVCVPCVVSWCFVLSSRLVSVRGRLHPIQL